jgi:SNF2 family DNA or RNA helicase
MTAAVAPTSLWAHQQQALDFALSHWDQGMRGIMLACVMGTGKSRIAIQAAHERQLSPLLIVCPLRVVEVWREQFERHLPGVYEFLALDSRAGTVTEKTRRARNFLGLNGPLAIAINYESARLEPFASFALARAWPLVIADESHRLKTPSGSGSRFVGKLGLRALHRLGLTGTPMPHSPLDVWAQFRFLDRTVYDPTYTSFRQRYAIMGGFHNGYAFQQVVGYQNLEELRQKFFSRSFQVGNEVLDLPGEREQNLYTDFRTQGAHIYQQMEREFVAILESGEEISAQNKLVQLLRLQQITSGSFADGQRFDVSKGELLRDLLEDLPAEEPVVVFCRFRPDLALVHHIARSLRRRSGEISGQASEVTGDRDDLAAFRRAGPDDPVILAVQLQSGGVGIDLTRARYAVYFSLGFNLADYLQSRARLYRAGQTRPVMFYHLFVRNTVDAMVARALERRQNLIEETLKELKCPHPLPKP